jgi:hypothetical protein
MKEMFNASGWATAAARSLSTIILIFLLGCTQNAPYRDLNVLNDPSTFGGYIGKEPQQKSFLPANTSGPLRLGLYRIR